MIDPKQMYLSSMLEEYKTLREESKQASINMLTAFRWGGAAVGTAFGVGFLAWYHKLHLAVLVVFFLLVPILSALSMFLWLGEAIRFKRVGDFLCLIEHKVGFILKDFVTESGFADAWGKLQHEMETDIGLPHALTLADPIGWERWLRAARAHSSIFKLEGHQALAYLLRLASFPILMVFSLLIAVYYLIANPRFTPEFLKSVQPLVISGKEGASFLLWVSVGIIMLSLFSGGFIAAKLLTKARPSIKGVSPIELAKGGNGT